MTLRSIRRTLSSPHGSPPLPVVADRAIDCLRMLFLMTLWVGVARFRRLLSIDFAAAADPLWPVAWLQPIAPNVGPPLVGLAVVGFALAALVWWWSQPVRIALAVSLLMTSATLNSFGKISHGDHMLIWMLAIAATLPTAAARGQTRADQLRRAETIWFATTTLLWFYFLSGLWKIVGGLVQLALAEPNVFSSDALSRHIAARLLQTSSASGVGDWLIAHPVVGTVLFWGAIYLELGSLLLPFRRALHQLWGVGLILMHVGIGAAMTIWFDGSIVLVGILLVCSPWRSERNCPTVWKQLPGLWWLFRRRSTSERTLQSSPRPAS